ncbi:uncharacterized protein LOC131218141 [Magnolia sinica]|uniref:uncharacterized protein LOC131218141 n=1 Tax=Magnolia sinica TaxID=86752 RepID=UPI002659CF70|nr:uncharacterized protein LOC131218141 [Magnolia sinica]
MEKDNPTLSKNAYFTKEIPFHKGKALLAEDSLVRHPPSKYPYFPRHIFPVRIKKSSTIGCCRAYQSSGPVRYTPKKYSLGRENQNSQHTKSSKEKAIDRSSDSSFSKATFSHDRTVTHRLSNANDGSQYQFSSVERISDAETMNSSNMIGGMVEFSDLDDDTSHDQEVMDHHLIDEAEQHNGQFNISDDNGVFEKDATHAGKTKQDAEKMAVEVLATRFEYLHGAASNLFNLGLISWTFWLN